MVGLGLGLRDRDRIGLGVRDRVRVKVYRREGEKRKGERWDKRRSDGNAQQVDG